MTDRPTPPSPDRATTADLLTAASRAARRRTRAALAPLDISPATARALRTLARAGAPMRMSELADALDIERRSATDVVDQLVERGLVERRADPADRRATAIQLTSAGKQHLKKIVAARSRISEQLTADLSNDEVATLNQLLARLAPHPNPVCDER